MQINAQLDDELSAVDAQQLAERLAAKPAMGACVALATRLKHACRMHDKAGADDAGTMPVDAAVYVTSAYCLRVMGDLLAAQAVAERGLLQYPTHVPLVDELVAVHEALARRYQEVARRYQSAHQLPSHSMSGGDGD